VLQKGPFPVMHHALFLVLQHDQDVVTARQRAAQLAQTLAFDLSEQTRIATAVSEIVRNAFRYSGEGLVDFFLDGEARPQRLVIRVAGGRNPAAESGSVARPRRTAAQSSRKCCTSTASSRTRIEASSRSTPSSMKRRITSDELTS
jgi:plasmid stabilization system protein ParE